MPRCGRTRVAALSPRATCCWLEAYGALPPRNPARRKIFRPGDEPGFIMPSLHLGERPGAATAGKRVPAGMRLVAVGKPQRGPVPGADREVRACATGLAVRRYPGARRCARDRGSPVPGAERVRGGGREAGCRGGERESLRGETPGGQGPWRRAGDGRRRGPDSRRDQAFGAEAAPERAAQRQGRNGARRRVPDLREEQRPEGGSSGALPGGNPWPGRAGGPPRRAAAAARSGRADGSLKAHRTPRAGSGGGWQPRTDGSARLAGAEEHRTLRRAAALRCAARRREPVAAASGARRSGGWSTPCRGGEGHRRSTGLFYDLKRLGVRRGAEDREAAERQAGSA
ncbi:MAG: hypothetical protein KatS3mg102_2278 [Planctomycetota bacterium]|nr:MAG: hypothetical protein KatS3mg102_2278 [Planctomycetota bacterium]